MSETPIADLIVTMHSKGSPVEMIVIAVRAMEIVSRGTQRHATSRATPEQRSPGAIRSARWRANHRKNKANAEANDAASADPPSVTPQRHAQRHGVTAPCNLLSSLLPKKGTPEEVSKKEAPSVAEGKAKKATRLNPESPLSDADLKFAIANGLTPERARSVWAEFVDYWTGVPGQRGTKLNWPGTWRNWVRRSAPKVGGKGGEFKWRSGIEGVT